MTDTIHNTILPMTDTTAEPEDYTGEDGLLYCGKCRKPKEAYFPEGKTFFGRDRHPSECDCQRAARKEREAACVRSGCRRCCRLSGRGAA